MTHLEETGLTYWEHCGYALRIVGTLARITAALVIHAFLPSVFTHTASATIIELAEKLKK